MYKIKHIQVALQTIDPYLIIQITTPRQEDVLNYATDTKLDQLLTTITKQYLHNKYAKHNIKDTTVRYLSIYINNNTDQEKREIKHNLLSMILLLLDNYRWNLLDLQTKRVNKLLSITINDENTDKVYQQRVIQPLYSKDATLFQLSINTYTKNIQQPTQQVNIDKEELTNVILNSLNALYIYKITQWLTIVFYSDNNHTTN